MKKLLFKMFRVFGAAFYELGREDFVTPCPWDDEAGEKTSWSSESSEVIDTWHPPVKRDWQGGRFGNPIITFREAHGHDCPTCNGRGMAHMGNPPCPTCGS